MRIKKKILKFLIYSFVSFFIFYLLLNLFLNIQLSKTLIEKNVNGLKIEKIRTFFPFYFKIYNIKYKNKEFSFIASELKLSIAPFDLISKKIHIYDFVLQDPKIILFKNGENEKNKKDKKQNLSSLNQDDKKDKKFKLPFKLYIDSFSINNIYANVFEKYKIEKLNLFFMIKLNDVSKVGNLAKLHLFLSPDAKLYLLNKYHKSEFELNVNLEKTGDFNSRFYFKFDKPIKKVNFFSVLLKSIGNLKSEKLFIKNFVCKYDKERIIDFTGNLSHFFSFDYRNIKIKRAAIKIDLKKSLNIAKSNFEIPSVSAKGKLNILFTGDWNNSFADVKILNANFSYNNIEFNNMNFYLNAKGNKFSFFMKPLLKIKRVSAKGYKAENFVFDASFTGCGKDIKKVKLNELSFESMGGKLILNGKSDFLKNISYSLKLHDFVFINYFNLPLYAKLNSKINVSGRNFSNLVFDIFTTLKDIDYRKDNFKAKIPKITLKGNAACDLNKKSFYLSYLTLELGNKSKISVEGLLNGDSAELSFLNSKIYLAELKNYFNVLKKYDFAGTLFFTGNMQKNGKQIVLTSQNYFKNLKYRKDNIAISGGNGMLWLDFNKKRNRLKTVFEMKIKKVNLASVKISGVKLSIPYYYGNFNENDIKVAGKNNIEIDALSYKKYKLKKFKGLLMALNKKLFFKNFDAHLLDGQLGGAFFFDMDKKKIAFSLNGIDLNLRKTTNKTGISYFSFTSKVRGTDSDLNGFFDISRIDKDVLERFLISMDPDKQNPQVQSIRKKMNMVGIVPKRIYLSISNGYVDIEPKFGFRSANIVSFFLKFIVGGVDVEPIRRIPLNYILEDILDMER